MAIHQERLNEAAAKAIAAMVGLLPTVAGEVATKSVDDGLEIVIGNPRRPDRPLTIETMGEELTVYFADSHYHIADYGQNKTEADLVEDMILGISGILSGHTTAYSAWSGNAILGGGFLERNSETELRGEWWSRAERFEVSSWDGSGDKIVPGRVAHRCC